MRRPLCSGDRLCLSGSPRRFRASIPASYSTRARRTIPCPEDSTNPYQPTGTVNSHSVSSSTLSCFWEREMRLGRAISNAVMNTSLASRSIQSVESRMATSSFRNGMSSEFVKDR